MPISVILFSFTGRISRSEYWKGFLIMLPLAVLNNILAFAVEPGGAIIIVLFLAAIGAWTGLALSIKRLHDRDRSGLWLLTLLIPFLGIIAAIWLLIEIWFMEGTDGANRFGEDPRNRRQEVSTRENQAVTSGQ